MITITTDHKWKQFKYRHEVPKRTLRDDFDWLDPATLDGFFRYQRRWYHLAEFMRSDQFPGWHGCAADSYFSGVVIRISSDGECYQVGTAIS